MRRGIINYLLGIAVTASCMALQSCDNEPEAGDNTSTESRATISMSSEERIAAEAINHFGSNMLKSISESAGNGNTVFSPLSAAMVTGMVANGMEPSETEEVMEAFGLEGNDLNTLNSLMNKTIAELPSLDSKNRIAIANSIWHKERVAVLDDYTALVKDVFNADKYLLTTDGAANQSKVNKWCDANTDGMIKEFSVDPLVNFMALNALYFAGEWKSPFKKSDTHKERFTNADGSRSNVMMMKGKQQISYGRTSDYTAVSLSYYLNSYSATIVMPEKPVSEFIASLGDRGLSEIETNMQGSSTLIFPRFSLEPTELDLREALIDAGLSVIFRSNYSGISLSGLGSNNMMRQVSAIEVDESGTVAASISGFDNLGAALDAPKLPEEVKIDRPFIFIVRNVDTGIIVTAAIVNLL